jgi:uncharacterized membrane protein YccF (DUF307 family)
VGILWGRASFTIGKFVFWPFGREAIDGRIVSGEKDIRYPAWSSVSQIFQLGFVSNRKGDCGDQISNFPKLVIVYV